MKHIERGEIKLEDIKPWRERGTTYDDPWDIADEEIGELREQNEHLRALLASQTAEQQTDWKDAYSAGFEAAKALFSQPAGGQGVDGYEVAARWHEQQAKAFDEQAAHDKRDYEATKGNKLSLNPLMIKIGSSQAHAANHLDYAARIRELAALASPSTPVEAAVGRPANTYAYANKVVQEELTRTQAVNKEPNNE